MVFILGKNKKSTVIHALTLNEKQIKTSMEMVYKNLELVKGSVYANASHCLILAVILNKNMTSEDKGDLYSVELNLNNFSLPSEIQPDYRISLPFDNTKIEDFSRHSYNGFTITRTLGTGLFVYNFTYTKDWSAIKSLMFRVNMKSHKKIALHRKVLLLIKLKDNSVLTRSMAFDTGGDTRLYYPHIKIN